MKAQLLYFDGCPNAAAAREAFRQAVAKQGLVVRLEEVCTTSADTPPHLRGWGSPTILIDGADIGGLEGPASANCRLYRDATGRLSGVPPVALVESALARAQRRRSASAEGGDSR